MADVGNQYSPIGILSSFSRYHSDTFPRAFLYTQRAAGAVPFNITAYIISQLWIWIGEENDAVHRTKLDTDLTTCARFLVNERNELRLFLDD